MRRQISDYVENSHATSLSRSSRMVYIELRLEKECTGGYRIAHYTLQYEEDTGPIHRWSYSRGNDRFTASSANPRIPGVVSHCFHAYIGDRNKLKVYYIQSQQDCEFWVGKFISNWFGFIALLESPRLRTLTNQAHHSQNRSTKSNKKWCACRPQRPMYIKNTKQIFAVLFLVQSKTRQHSRSIGWNAYKD